MVRKFLVVITFAVLILGASTLQAQEPQQPPHQPPAQAQAETKTISGKVTAVTGQSFTLEVAGDPAQPDAAKQSMEFVVDANTAVRGELKEGATATVEYSAEGGQNRAVRVVVEGAK
ncbi:MAG: hypothetical protein ACRD5G_07150 [Candidatus Acidiferrales bacterium]